MDWEAVYTSVREFTHAICVAACELLSGSPLCSGRHSSGSVLLRHAHLSGSGSVLLTSLLGMAGRRGCVGRGCGESEL